tara:strand:+ start:44 stop:562 length:519 start_codon:yes stop_codon:yes gene_type:complete
MFTGNPHQDQRGRKSFTSGWKSGWSDFKNNRDLQGPMNPGGQLPRPNPWNGKPFPKGQEPTMIPMNQTAGFDPGNRRPIYDRNGKLVPQRPVLGNKWNLPRDIPVPSMDYVGSRTASNDYGYGTDNFYNPNDDEYYDDYSDMYKDNPMRDDFYVQDPFSDIWGNQGGPLSFS